MGALTILALVILAIALALSDDKPVKPEAQEPEKQEEETNAPTLSEVPWHYGCTSNGTIYFRTNYHSVWYNETIYVPKQFIVELSNDMIKCYRFFDQQNHSPETAIEHKEDLKTWQEKWGYEYRYIENKYITSGWKETVKSKIEDFDFKVTPIQEVFTDKLGGKYKLIESVDELNAYLLSKLSCDDWCRLKLISTMKSLNLGDGFITGFSDLIGNDLEKYHLMIDLSKEVKDIDTLMYMFVYKFGKKGE